MVKIAPTGEFRSLVETVDIFTVYENLRFDNTAYVEMLESIKMKGQQELGLYFHDPIDI